MTSSGKLSLERDVNDWRIIDAIGPFMRNIDRKCINWSKMIYSSLDFASKEADEKWRAIEEDMLRFCRSVKEMGYNTVTIDDVVHLTSCSEHSEEITQKIALIEKRMRKIFALIKQEGMKILVTTDLIPLSNHLLNTFGSDSAKLEHWFETLIYRFIEQYPEVDGVILRLGESDGKDVNEMFLSSLYAKSAKTANALIKSLLPVFEKQNKVLVCRNWTVGAHAIGDLIWHRRTLARLLEGIDSKAFIFSLKYGETDFFRYLPLNSAFFRTDVQKIVEFQARREYEGAGEFPSFVGYDVEAYAKQLKQANNIVGFSVWCQTGGWHAFRRIAFIDKEAFWIEQNVAAIASIFGEGMTVQEWISATYPDQFNEVEYFLSLNDRVIKQGLYISEFASQKWFFRRTRIPPMLHIYWDCIFVNHPVRKMMRYFISDHERMKREMDTALEGAKTLHHMAQKLQWQPDDLEFLYDTLSIVALAKEYYVCEFTDELKERIKVAKKAYKQKYPRSSRQRYRIKVDYARFKFSLRKVRLLSLFLLRRKRRYRILDHLFTLHLLRYVYRIFKRRNEKSIPDFMKDSAMGIDVLFD